MILAAESTLFGRVTDLDHEIDEILDREDRVVEDRVLRVDSLDKRPIFTDELNIVRIHPEVGCVHQVEEELWASRLVFFGEWQLDAITKAADDIPNVLASQPFRFIDSKEQVAI